MPRVSREQHIAGQHRQGERHAVDQHKDHSSRERRSGTLAEAWGNKPDEAFGALAAVCKLRGKSAEYLRTVAGQAISADSVFERDRIGAVRIETDGHSPEEAAGLIAEATGWPQQPGA